MKILCWSEAIVCQPLIAGGKLHSAAFSQNRSVCRCLYVRTCSCSPVVFCENPLGCTCCAIYNPYYECWMLLHGNVVPLLPWKRKSLVLVCCVFSDCSGLCKLNFTQKVVREGGSRGDQRWRHCYSRHWMKRDETEERAAAFYPLFFFCFLLLFILYFSLYHISCFSRLSRSWLNTAN